MSLEVNPQKSQFMEFGIKNYEHIDNINLTVVKKCKSFGRIDVKLYE